MKRELYYQAQGLISEIELISETAASIKEILDSCKRDKTNTIKLYVSNSSVDSKTYIGAEAAELALEFEIERCNESILKKRKLLAQVTEQAICQKN